MPLMYPMAFRHTSRHVAVLAAEYTLRQFSLLIELDALRLGTVDILRFEVNHGRYKARVR